MTALVIIGIVVTYFIIMGAFAERLRVKQGAKTLDEDPVVVVSAVLWPIFLPVFLGAALVSAAAKPKLPKAKVVSK